jgi:precorrin-6B C5,15-methyltransferase / cobalt-precorrin-6B C5,C15-methyltransferase
MKRSRKPKLDEWRPPLVLLVGLGMGKDDLSLKVLQWLQHAEVLAGGKRHLDVFPEFTGEKVPMKSSLDEFIESVKDISEQKRTAVLASGDPLFFGIGRRLVAVLGRERVVAFPNITSIQALFSSLREPWEDVRVLSLHGRAKSAQPTEWLRAVRSASRVALFTDPQHHPGWVAEQLLDAGILERSLIIAEDLGLPTENIRHMSLEEARTIDFSPLNVVVVTAEGPGNRPGASVQNLPVFGLPESAFEHDAGMITKMEVRAVVLAHLQLEPGLVMWDLGAGSGSVSIEAARIAPLKQIISVEKNLKRYEALKQNVKTFGASEIQAVCGSIREVIDRLPDPDRVFIGGSGGELGELLPRLAQRLRPAGRIVQTVVALDTLESVRAFWREKPVELSITQLQVSRSAAIAHSLRFEALNPVFVVSVWSKKQSSAKFRESGK